MAGTKKPTHLIAQKNQYFAKGEKGRLVELGIGDPVTLTKAQAEKMGKRVIPVSQKATLDLTGGKGKESSTED